MIISYAQDAEDVLLRRVFPGDYRGFYVDAGASDPVRFSVTKHFYDHGWRGVNIEPVPSVCARLRDRRPRDVNLNAGLSDREGTLTFYEVLSESTWSSFSPEVGEALRARGEDVRAHDIAVTTLSRVCEQYAPAVIDVLKVDVEAHEREVISGGDWARWRPRVVLVENNGPERWEPLLLGHGYRHAITTETNRYYVRDEDRDWVEVLREPLRPTDAFVLAGDPAATLLAVLSTKVPPDVVEAWARGEGPGVNTLRLAMRVQRLGARHPRLAALGKALARLAG